MREFFKRWKEGIQTLSPEQLIRSKYYGLMGGVIGYILALIFLIYDGFWYFTIVILAAAFIQSIELISTYQQINNLKKTRAAMENLEEFLEVDDGEKEN